MKIILLLLLMSLSPNAFSIIFEGGGMDSGGGDLKPAHEGAAWFLGDGQISFCIERSSSFIYSKEELQNQVKWSLNQWGNYLKERLYGLPLPWEEEPEIMISTNFVFWETCHDDIDLTFYFGKKTPLIEKLFYRYTAPIGFAYKSHYKDGWGKGFIWIKNEISAKYNWDHGNSLITILLHEVGHIFGNPHFDESIMREDIAKYISEGFYAFHPFSKRIDHEKLLLQKSKKAPGGFIDVYKDKSRDVFYLLTGRQAKGDIASILKDSQYLILKDTLGEYTFQLNLPIDTTVSFSEKLFKAERGARGRSVQSGGGSLFGNFLDKKNKNHTIILEVNKYVSHTAWRDNPNINYSKVGHRIYNQLSIIEGGKRIRLYGPGFISQ